MAGLYYLGKPWQDNVEPPDDYADDLEELPTHCLECGVELEEGEKVLCVDCVAQLNIEPARQDDSAPDDQLEGDYDERNGDIEDGGPPF